jgi:hypothetical protein
MSKKVLFLLTCAALALALVAAPAFGMQAEKAKGKAEKAEAKTPPQKGMVWANTDSKVYHKEGSRWYGKTKDGKWMTEEDAKKEGFKEAGSTKGTKESTKDTKEKKK